MNISKKRLPNPDDELTSPFWNATQRGELRVQRCHRCGFLRWPPAPICPECLASDHEWVAMKPEGSLISFCTYHRPLDPAFETEVPYAVGYVQTSDGPRMYGQIEGPIEELTIEQKVKAVFSPLTAELTLVKWRPTKGPGPEEDS